MLKHVEPIADFLRGAGAERVRLEHGGKHPRLVYAWQGSERFYVVAATPGDRRATMNALSDLRRSLGLTETKKRVGERRAGKRKTGITTTTPEPQAIAFAPDWRESLTSHPAVLALDQLPIEHKGNPLMLAAKTAAAANVAVQPSLVKSSDRAPAPLSKLLVNGAMLTITPELADRIIEQCEYDLQRPIRPAHVATIAEQMRRREWTSGTQIHFARLPDGLLVLLNGNHRLHAVDKADTPVAFQILVTDVANPTGLRTLYRRHDRLYAGRTISDALMAEGIGEKFGLRKEIATACFRAMTIIDSNFRGSRLADPYLTRSDEHRFRVATEWWPVAQQFQDAITNAPTTVKKTLQTAGVTAVALVTLHHQEAKADAFWRGLADNDGLRAGDPRRTYLSHLAVPKARSDAMAAKTVTLPWNAFFRDRKLQLIRVLDGPLTILGTAYGGAAQE